MGDKKKMTKEELKPIDVSKYTITETGQVLKMNKNKCFLNSGRGSGKTFRLLCETYENKIAELEAQIEKMKCCYNCKFDNLEPPEVIGNGICEHCKNHSKWELQY